MEKVIVATSRLIACALLGAAVCSAAPQPSVRIQPLDLQGPRQLSKETEAAVIRDYLQSWGSLKNAFASNESEMLNSDYVGEAKKKLSNTINTQASLSIHTYYSDLAHDIQIVLYSPEGLSVELVDRVQYTMEVFEHGQSIANQKRSARYIIVMTPSQVRWKVRILQATQE